jgi:hypothetical protein
MDKRHLVQCEGEGAGLMGSCEHCKGISGTIQGRKYLGLMNEQHLPNRGDEFCLLHCNTLFFKLFHCHFVTNLTNSLYTCSVQRM